MWMSRPAGRTSGSAGGSAYGGSHTEDGVAGCLTSKEPTQADVDREILSSFGRRKHVNLGPGAQIHSTGHVSECLHGHESGKDWKIPEEYQKHTDTKAARKSKNSLSESPNRSDPRAYTMYENAMKLIVAFCPDVVIELCGSRFRRNDKLTVEIACMLFPPTTFSGDVQFLNTLRFSVEEMIEMAQEQLNELEEDQRMLMNSSIRFSRKAIGYLEKLIEIKQNK